MNRKVITLTVVLAFVLGMSGLAQGQTYGVYIDQTGPNNDGFGHQDNTNNLIDVDQTSGTDPGGWFGWGADKNRAHVVQLGELSVDNIMDIDQSGDGSNHATAQQEGSWNIMDIDQVAFGSDNTAGISALWGWIRLPVLQDGDNNQMKIDQTATGGDNLALAEQRGNDNQMDIKQAAYDGDNKAGKAGLFYYEPLLQDGDRNKMTSNQIAGGSNLLAAEQVGNDNTMNIYQFARNGDNEAGDGPLLQDGDHNYMKIRQSTWGGDNLALAEQRGDDNKIWIDQDAAADNTVGGREWHSKKWCGGWWEESPILQEGDHNKLVGASTTGCLAGTEIDYCSPATQISRTGSNELNVQQLGDCNKVGLYQWALGDNSADILQEGDSNYLAVWQTNNVSSNSVIAKQIGDGHTAKVWQDTWDGPGIVEVYQGP